MVFLRRLVLVLLITLVAQPTFARQLEGVDPNGSFTKIVTEKAEGLKAKAKETWAELKSEAKTWWNSVRPKTDEEIAREERVATIKRRQSLEKKQQQELEEALPTYKSQEVGNYKNFLDKAESGIANQEGVFAEEGAVAAQGDLPKTREGVPVFSLSGTKQVKGKDGKTRTINIKVDDIPSLNVGQEPTISRHKFLVADYKMTLERFNMAKALRSPDTIPQNQIDKHTKKEVVVAKDAIQLKRNDFGMAEVVTEKKINDLALKPELPVDEYKIYTEFTKNELRMLAALILYSKGDKCHVVAGIFDELSQDKGMAREANFHLGICSVRMGFYSEAINRLIPLIRAEDKDYAKASIEELAKQLPREFEVPFAKAIRNLKNKDLFNVPNVDRVYYLTAKGSYTQGSYKSAKYWAIQVPSTSSDYTSAQYLHAISDYNLGQKSEAKAQLEKLLAHMDLKKVEDKNLRTLVNINLARINFQTNDFKKALAHYMKVDKKHPLWVQGLIEQGWTQIMAGDYAGAIGNMYSLHSPYFKSVYMPESWAVRTIGYLNICQYGDAYNSLTTLEKKYSTWHAKVKTFIKKNKKAKDYYFTTVNYLKGKSDKDYNGLPHQVIREMARRRGYLNHQNSINRKVDELAQYNFIYEMIKQDKQKMEWRIRKAKERVAKIKADILKTKEKKELLKNLTEWRQQLKFEKQLIVKLKFQLGAIEKGRLSYKRMKEVARKRIDKEIYVLREKAGKSLVKTLYAMKDEIHSVLDNNEFLRYEVFAGSGENIRFQVAGGAKAKNRIKADVTPPKSLSWQFQGEYWEDEIGSYRSTLKNNCPMSRQNAAAFSGGQ